MLKFYQRRQRIAQESIKLTRNGFPRLQMFLIVMLTGGAGFLTSFVLLQFGFEQMWQRYLFAFITAYLAFLCFLWLWLNTRSDDYDVDVSNFNFSSNQSPRVDVSGGGGDAAGGGAGGSFDAIDDDVYSVADSPIGTVFEGAVEAEELAIPIMLVLCAILLFFSTFFVVYSAPILLAELSVDAFLVARLYQGLQDIPRHHWLKTAFKRTWLPFLLTGLCVVGAGWFMGHGNPEVHSIGEYFVK